MAVQFFKLTIISSNLEEGPTGNCIRYLKSPQGIQIGVVSDLVNTEPCTAYTAKYAGQDKDVQTQGDPPKSA